MPTYEYSCKSCSADFDVFQSMSDEALKVCPTCGGSVRRKIGGGLGIIFKGSGFYKNDSRKGTTSSSASASASGSDAGSAAGSASGSAAGPAGGSDKGAKAECPSCPAPASGDSPKKEAP